MRSKVAQKILDETPKDVRIFVRKYGDIVVRINQLLREKGFTQKELADKLEKRPSEISKWLGGEHNFTLRSLSKLEAELGEEIIYVPKRESFHVQVTASIKATVKRRRYAGNQIEFDHALKRKESTPSPIPMIA
ncbi:MAG TPA: helix-turn-helix transcriptional regulator [Cyclobacteriaceae bacterium]|nr:helix-turn-helix transcriptional regulator [Cyclobacteriaceae bacterium]